jgi:hypothetical protein
MIKRICMGGKDMNMKKIIFAAIVALAIAPLGFAGPTFSVTVDASAGFAEAPTFEQAYAELTQTPNPLCGFGWELTVRNLGLGGSYMVNFSQAQVDPWVMDWYGEGLYIGYHFFGGGAFIDPFVQAGIGCAGQVTLLSREEPELLRLSLFPFVGAGAALNLGGFKAGAKFTYKPFVSPVPATWIPGYPVDPFSVTVFAGLSLGRR